MVKGKTYPFKKQDQNVHLKTFANTRRRTYFSLSILKSVIKYICRTKYIFDLDSILQLILSFKTTKKKAFQVKFKENKLYFENLVNKDCKRQTLINYAKAHWINLN